MNTVSFCFSNLICKEWGCVRIYGHEESLLTLQEAKGETLSNLRKAFLWESKVVKSGMSLVGTLI